ncbi:hypothetical protein [Nonomuraea sp. NPDC049784]|uniref:hypothetical protein n=1 Tax=Nonomuraea sp. NPDC049784 TaxID=3154361 RepID=UPI0034052A41
MRAKPFVVRFQFSDLLQGDVEHDSQLGGVIPAISVAHLTMIGKSPFWRRRNAKRPDLPDISLSGAGPRAAGPAKSAPPRRALDSVGPRLARQDPVAMEGSDMSHVYDSLPAPIVAACEQVIEAYLTGAVPSADPRLLDTSESMLLAESAALEAVAMLAEQQSSTSNLLFADLLEDPTFAPLAPAMRQILHFLRARLAGQNPTLRLDPATPAPTLTLLLIAAQALSSAAASEDDTTASENDSAAELFAEMKTRLAGEPMDRRVPAGDLAFGLDDALADRVDDETFLRDGIRRALTGTVPVRRVLSHTAGHVLVVLDLAARPDVEDLFRLLSADPPSGGADTHVRWRMLPMPAPAMSLFRLEINWLEPVHIDLAIAFDTDNHGKELRAIACAEVVALSFVDPADIRSGRHDPDAPVITALIPAHRESLTDLLSKLEHQ